MKLLVTPKMISEFGGQRKGHNNDLKSLRSRKPHQLRLRSLRMQLLVLSLLLVVFDAQREWLPSKTVPGVTSSASPVGYQVTLPAAVELSYNKVPDPWVAASERTSSRMVDQWASQVVPATQQKATQSKKPVHSPLHVKDSLSSENFKYCFFLIVLRKSIITNFKISTALT
ncbi:hypothetical protein DPMN_080742 [Dreissena polymorpha]|uniref:Uncharacterized protein n=1 Tax=Dreissena polymorpha TaxID=45954 RepID=A0A9D3YVN5_DREPO|nr:hypothetical protein DPMN_080742 [Dreissena polymorpha]